MKFERIFMKFERIFMKFERIFMKFDIWVCFENLSSNFKFHQNLSMITGTLHEDQYTLLIISRSVLRTMKCLRYICRDNRNVYLVIIKLLFSRIMPFMR